MELSNGLDTVGGVHQWGNLVDDSPNIQYVNGKHKACGPCMPGFVKLVHMGHNGLWMHHRKTSPSVHGRFNFIGDEAVCIQHESTSVQRREVGWGGVFYLHLMVTICCLLSFHNLVLYTTPSTTRLVGCITTRWVSACDSLTCTTAFRFFS